MFALKITSMKTEYHIVEIDSKMMQPENLVSILFVLLAVLMN